MFRANRHRPSEQHREQVLDLLPNAAVVYALMQHVEETFEYLRSEDRLSLPSGNVMVALASVGQLLGLVEADIERLLNFAEKEPSFVLTGMSFSEFVDAVRCLAVLHGHLALEALPVLQVPDLSKALYNTYMSYSQALRPHFSGAICRCRQVAGEPPPRLFWESFLRLCRDAGFVQPEGPLASPSLERIWLGSSSICDRNLPEHMCFGQFLRSLAVVAGQVKSEVFVPVAALGMAQEVPALKTMPNTYRLKHYKEVPLNLGGKWSLPHLTFDALAKAVHEGRQYEYSQFLADAQETSSHDEAQRRQSRASGALSAVDPADSFIGSIGGLSPRRHGLSPRKGDSTSSSSGGVRSGAANGRVRPWSAGLTVLSPHPRRPGAGAVSTPGLAAAAVTSAVTPTKEEVEGPPANPSTTANVVSSAPAASGDVNVSRPVAPVLSAWLVEEPSAATLHPHGFSAPGQLLPSPTSRALERSRSALTDHTPSHWAWDRERDRSLGGGHGAQHGGARSAGPPPSSPALPGVEGGGRVCLDSARPRALHSTTSFSMSTSPRVSGVAISGPAGPSSPGPGPASGLARLVSRRSTSNMEGPTVVVCACCGGSGSGVGTAAGMASPRCGNGEAMEYLAGSLRDVRRDVDGRLGTLEEHGRSVMQLLTQLQAQVLELQQQQQQQQQGQKQQQLPSESGPLAQVDTAPGTAAATSSAMEALEDAGEVLLRDAMQRQQQEGGTADGSALLPRTPLSPPSRSRSPSRPSSAAGSHEARVETARYGVVVKTSDVRGAGTDADVLLTIYGSKGDTGERLLSNGTYNFERGQVSTFVFTAADVGEVERLRVRMRTQGTSSASPSWHLDAIQVASSATGTRYRFPHCGWVDNVLGRECVLYCKGTAPDTDEDPPGWQPTPPRSPPQHTRQQPQSPPQQQQQEQLPPPADRRDLPLSPSPTLTPRPTDSGRNSPSPLSAPPGLPSPPQDVAKSPVAPPGFVRGVVPSGSAPQDQPTADGPSGNAKNGADYNRGMRTDNDDKLPGGDSSVALLQLEERVAELQRRLLQMEEEQAEYAMRAAAATAAAVLVRMPAQLLAAVRYGRKGPGAAVGEAHHHRGSGGGGTAAAAAVSGSSDSDNALMLLADLLTHLHALAEQGVTAAATADTQAGVAAEAARRQQSRLMQMQFELTATSQAAEQTAKSCEQISQQLEAIAAARPPPDIDGEPISMAESGEDGVENSGNEDGTGPLAMEIRQCKARLGTVAADVKRLAVEQGSGAVTAATSKVEAVLAETRAFQARLATSLADIAASLSSQRQAWEQGSDGGDPVGLVETAGAEGGPALQVAMDALQHELLQMAKMVAGRTGAGARGTRDCASGRHGGDAGNRILNDDVLSGDDGDSVPSRGSYASA